VNPLCGQGDEADSIVSERRFRRALARFCNIIDTACWILKKQRREHEMSVSTFDRFWFLLIVVCVAVQGSRVQGQQRGGTPQTDSVQPVNSGGNPYRVIRDWAQLTLEARPWGGSNGVAIDRDGKSVWATDRCSPGTAPGCLGTKANPVHKFDESGKEIRSFGGGMFVWPHGIHVDRDGNVWVADARAASPEELTRFPGEGNKGSAVVKFSPEGKVLLTLGKPGVRGNPPEALTDPTDVVTDASNGDVYVAESHTDVAAANLVGRVSVFDKTGKFLRTIGKAGTGPGEFRTPHALEFDSQGRLIVADRHNHRIQILTKDGKFLAEYDEFGRVSGLAIDKDDTIYTADSESTERVHAGWLRGIRIGSLKDGKVTMFIPPHKTDSPDGAMGEGIAIDAAGNLFTAEANLRGVTKYVKN
jgi:DNA-binding beta-propeller fold protein YncE